MGACRTTTQPDPRATYRSASDASYPPRFYSIVFLVRVFVFAARKVKGFALNVSSATVMQRRYVLSHPLVFFFFWRGARFFRWGES